MNLYETPYSAKIDPRCAVGRSCGVLAVIEGNRVIEHSILSVRRIQQRFRSHCC